MSRKMQTREQEATPAAIAGRLRHAQLYVMHKARECDGAIVPNIGTAGGPILRSLARLGLVRRSECYGVKVWEDTALGRKVHDHLNDDRGRYERLRRDALAKEDA